MVSVLEKDTRPKRFYHLLSAVHSYEQIGLEILLEICAAW